jgi:hypothetical protein
MRYYTTRAFPTASRQYEAGDAIDPASITAAEWIRGTESGAVVPARWYGTAAELAARGIPGPGVSVYETDTRIARVGDGATAVASLPQVGISTYAGLSQFADAYVDPSGALSGPNIYTTLSAAVAAISAGQRIVVLGNLTQTAAGQFDVGKRCTIDFQGYSIINACVASGVDVITSGLAANSTSYVNGVKIRNLGGISRSGSGRGGTAINLHGTMSWSVMPAGQDSTISDHAVGISFDANPAPAGYCFHNKVGGSPHKWRIATCGIAVQNINTANANEAGVYAYACDSSVNVTSGLALRLPQLTVESTAGAGTGSTQITLGGVGTTITGLYAESLTSNPLISVTGTGCNISGTAFNDTSGAVLSIGASADYYNIVLPQTQYKSNNVAHYNFADQSASSDTYTILRSTYTPLRIRRIDVIPDGYVGYTDSSNRWQLTLEDWIAGVNNGTVATVYNQAAQIDLAGITFAGFPITLATSHALRLKVSKVGTPPSVFYRAKVQIRYDEVPS